MLNNHVCRRARDAKRGCHWAPKQGHFMRAIGSIRSPSLRRKSSTLAHQKKATKVQLIPTQHSQGQAQERTARDAGVNRDAAGCHYLGTPQASQSRLIGRFKQGHHGQSGAHRADRTQQKFKPGHFPTKATTGPGQTGSPCQPIKEVRPPGSISDEPPGGSKTSSPRST